MITNEFLVRFCLDQEQNGILLNNKTLFGISNEEDNVLHFYYHVLDICKGLIDGNITHFQLPKFNNIEFENHEYAYHTKYLLESYMLHILNEIQKYESFKKSISPITEQ
jgi:hypothetical protein